MLWRHIYLDAPEYNLWGEKKQNKNLTTAQTAPSHDDMFHVIDITDKYISLINIFI